MDYVLTSKLTSLQPCYTNRGIKMECIYVRIILDSFKWL